MVRLIEAVRYKLEGSIPYGVIGLILPAALWLSGRHNL